MMMGTVTDWSVHQLEQVDQELEQVEQVEQVDQELDQVEQVEGYNGTVCRHKKLHKMN